MFNFKSQWTSKIYYYHLNWLPRFFKIVFIVIRAKHYLILICVFFWVCRKSILKTLKAFCMYREYHIKLYFWCRGNSFLPNGRKQIIVLSLLSSLHRSPLQPLLLSWCLPVILWDSSEAVVRALAVDLLIKAVRDTWLNLLLMSTLFL